MQRKTISSPLIAAALLTWIGVSDAADNKPATGTTAQSVGSASAPRKSAQAKLVDLNHASKGELKSLPGISDAMAAKIIAGRPYNSKAAIVTNGIVPEGIYVAIKNRIEVR
jgi:competence protein ComEA